MFNDDSLNCNVITLANDTTSAQNNMVQTETGYGDSNDIIMTPTQIDQTILNGINLDNETDSFFVAIKFKSEINRIASARASNGNLYDAIGWKMTSNFAFKR